MVSNYVLLAATPFSPQQDNSRQGPTAPPSPGGSSFPPGSTPPLPLATPHPWQHLRRRCSAHPQVLPRLRAAGGDGGRSLLCSGSFLRIRPALAVRTAPAAPHPRPATARFHTRSRPQTRRPRIQVASPPLLRPSSVLTRSGADPLPRRCQPRSPARARPPSPVPARRSL